MNKLLQFLGEGVAEVTEPDEGINGLETNAHRHMLTTGRNLSGLLTARSISKFRLCGSEI